MADCNCGTINISDENGVTEINSSSDVRIDYVPVAPVGDPASPGLSTVCVSQPVGGEKKMTCGCKQKLSVPGDCCSQPPSKTCCDNVQYATPQPYYQTAPLCAEDHQKCVVNNSFTATLKVQNSWNIPDCQASAVLSIPGLSRILPGSYLWNQSYGYFQVVSYDSTNGQVTVQNNCTSGNASVGTQVPSCTDFIVAPPPVSSSGGGGVPTIYPYLALDFTAPANGTCIPITLTTTAGLSVGKNIQIGTGVYQLSSISNSTNVTICNIGVGAIPGTPVLARDSEGNLQYPVILIDTNPCTNTPVARGALLACANNVSQPLSGATAGAIPVLVNAATGEVEFQVLNIPTSTCSIITCCLTLIAGQANYSFPVQDASQFVVGDILQIGTRTDRLTVTAIDTVNNILTGTIAPTPATTVTLPVATSICAASCCEQLQTEIDQINNDLTANVTTIVNNILNGILGTPTSGAYCAFNFGQALTAPAEVDSGNGPSGSLTSNGDLADGPLAEILVQNPSPCKNMVVTINTHFFWSAAVQAGNNDWVNFRYTPRRGIAVGAIGTTTTPARSSLYDIDRTNSINDSRSGTFSSPNDFVDHNTYVAVIPPGQEIRLAAQARLELQNGSTVQINYGALRTIMNASGIGI